MEKDKPKKGRPKKIVTTETFTEVARHDWNSENECGLFMASIIKMAKYSTVLEVGVFEGETAQHLIQAIPKGGLYVGIDINDYLNHDLNSFGAEVEFILGESIEVMQGMDPEQFDLIFVDGDHSWANILPEFKEAERIIKPGGIMAYHDTIHIPDVKKLMEYVAHYNYNVITLNTSEGRGLSLIQKL